MTLPEMTYYSPTRKNMKAWLMALFLFYGIFGFAQEPIFTSPAPDTNFYELSAFSYAGSDEEYSVFDQVTVANGLVFNADGTRMFVIGVGRSVVAEYDLAVAFDVSTASYNGQEEELDLSLFAPEGLAFNAEGTRLFVIDSQKDAVIEYDLAIAYDVSTATFNGVEEQFSVSQQESTPTGLAFNPDGTRMFVVGSGKDAVVSYDLAIGFDVSTAVYNEDAGAYSIISHQFAPTDITFNDIGSKMFIVGAFNPAVSEYHLSNAFDLSTAVFIGSEESLTVLTQESNPEGIAFDPSGTKLFLVGSLRDAVIEYDLNSAFDVSTASHTGPFEDFTISSQESFPTGITFSPNGEKMYILGPGRDAVLEYVLMVPFDVSTATFDEPEKLALAPVGINPLDLEFNGDGSRLFILSRTNNSIAEFDLDVPFDVSSATFNGPEEEFSLTNEIQFPQSLAFSQDGLKLVVLEGGNFDDAVIEYSLSVAFDVSTAAYSGSAEEYSILRQSVQSEDLSFNGDGTKMFVLDRNRDVLIEYELATPYDVSTASYGGFTHEFSVKDREGQPLAFAFDDQGTKIFLVGSGNRSVVEFALAHTISFQENSTAIVIDVDAHDGSGGGVPDMSVTYQLEGPDAMLFTVNDSGAIFFKNAPDFENPQDDNQDNAYEVGVVASDGNNQSGKKLKIEIEDLQDTPIITNIFGESFDVSAAVYNGDEEGFSISQLVIIPDGLEFSPDGLQMFTLSTFQEVLTYSLKSAFDVSTASFAGPDKLFSVRDFVERATDFTFNEDGTKMFVLETGDENVLEFNLATAYDLSTAVYNGEIEAFSVSNQVSNPSGIEFSEMGTRMFVFGGGLIFEYDLSSAFDVSTASYNGDAENFKVSGRGFVFDNTGSKMFVMKSSEVVEEYLLEIPFDVSTAFYNGKLEDLDISAEETGPYDLAFDAQGLKLFVVGSQQKSVLEYTIGAVVDFSENSVDSILDIEAIDSPGGTVDVGLTYGLEGIDAPYFNIDSVGRLTFLFAPNYEIPQDADHDNVYDVRIRASNSFESVYQNLQIRVVNEPDMPVFVDLGISFDVSTAIYNGDGKEFTVAIQERMPTGLVFSNDGTRMFVIGDENHSVIEYDLGVAFDVSTATYNGRAEELRVGEETESPQGLAFDREGSRLFIISNLGYGLDVYELATPFDVSTATYTGLESGFDLSEQSVNTLDLAFSPDGMRMFVLGNIMTSTSFAIFEYDLVTSFDVSTAVYNGEFSELLLSDHLARPSSFAFNEEGTRVFVLDNFVDEKVVAYELGLAFDLSTATYSGEMEEFSLPGPLVDPKEIVFSRDGTKFFIVDDDFNNIISEFAIGGSVTVDENVTDPVLNVDAVDGFGGVIDSVTYHLEGPDGALFSIDAAGFISFNRAPDFETPVDTDQDNLYELEVVARKFFDAAVQLIQVQVTDVVDEEVLSAPDFVEELIVYPNPTGRQTLKIRLNLQPTVGRSSMKLFSIRGDEVLTLDRFEGLDSGLIQLDISAVPPGLYFLHLNIDGTRYTEKIRLR